MASERQTGSVKFFSSDRGYGFIAADGGGPDVFVHIRELRHGKIEALREGQSVTFETQPGKEGKGPKAINIQVAG